MTADVQISTANGVQTLRFARAGKKNAITLAMYKALADALIAGDASDDVLVHVILGAPGIFCSGNDIAEFLVNAKGGQLGADGARLIRQLPQVKKPLIAGVDGPAIGIGTTLLMHCDLVYATPGSVFGTPFLDLGLVPEAASSLTMTERFGTAWAFEMLVLGETWNAERALAARLLNAIVPAAELEAKVMSVAARLAKKPPEAVMTSKRLMRGDLARVLAHTDTELTEFARRLRTAEALEAFTAFLEKRPADFAKLRRKG